MQNLLTDRNVAEATKRIAAAYKLATPNRINALVRLEKFVGRELYRKAHDRYTVAQHFATGPYKNERPQEYGGGGGQYVEMYKP